MSEPHLWQVPTREQLAVAGHKWSWLKGDEAVYELDEIDYDRADEILEILALIPATSTEGEPK